MSFYIFGKPESKLRLKSFSASNRGGKSTIRIELETEDHFELGYALQSLAETQKEQRAKPKPPAKPKLLALPKPGGA